MKHQLSTCFVHVAYCLEVSINYRASSSVDHFKVFGNQARLGQHAKEHTIDGRMRNDPELVIWRRLQRSWCTTSRKANEVSWSALHLQLFPVFQRFRDVELEGLQAKSVPLGPYTEEDVRHMKSRGRAAGRWVMALKHVLKEVHSTLLKNGTPAQRQTFRQLTLLETLQRFLHDGRLRATAILSRLEILTRHRIFTTTRVLICTVDSTERMLRSMEEGTSNATAALGLEVASTPARLSLDTVIMDEAACVLETAIPVVLALGVKNLTLVGDHLQLQPFSHVREGAAGTKHTRSLMERALDSGAEKQLLRTQYRMHPRICQVGHTPRNGFLVPL